MQKKKYAILTLLSQPILATEREKTISLGLLIPKIEKKPRKPPLAGFRCAVGVNSLMITSFNSLTITYVIVCFKYSLFKKNYTIYVISEWRKKSGVVIYAGVIYTGCALYGMGYIIKEKKFYCLERICK